MASSNIGKQPLTFDPRIWWVRMSARVRWFGALVILVVALAVVFSEGLMASALESGDAWATRTVDDLVQNRTGIVLLGHVYDIDISARSVEISWLILGCGDFKLPGTLVYSYKGYCGILQHDVDFYVDGATEATYSYKFDTIPRNRATGAYIFVQPMQAFSTTHLLVLYAWRGLDQQYGFPFDGYQLGTTITALDSSTNASLPLLGVRPISSTKNFKPRLRFDVESEAMNPTVASADTNGDNNDNNTAQSRTMEMAFARTGFAKTYVMTLFLLNWALAAVCVWITVSACVGAEVTEAILLLPISVILTIPALRALWDGAPAFGLLLDSCGTFLQMVIVATCSIFLVIQVGTNHRDAKGKKRDQAQTTNAAQPPQSSPDLRGKYIIMPEKGDAQTEDEKHLLDRSEIALNAV